MKEILATNYDLSFYEDIAIENLKANDMDITEDNVYQEELAISDIEYDFFNQVIEKTIKEKDIIAKGYIERWNGTNHGHSPIKTMSDFYELLKDCDYVEFYRDNGFFVKGTHHDGNVCFELLEMINDTPTTLNIEMCL